MQAKYIRLEGISCNEGCDVKGNWHIEIIRGGDKPNFIICSNCGNKIEVK